MLGHNCKSFGTGNVCFGAIPFPKLSGWVLIREMSSNRSRFVNSGIGVRAMGQEATAWRTGDSGSSRLEAARVTKLEATGAENSDLGN